MQPIIVYQTLAKKHNLIFKGIQKDLDGSTAFILFNDTIGEAKGATYAISPEGFGEEKLLEHIQRKRAEFETKQNK